MSWRQALWNNYLSFRCRMRYGYFVKYGYNPDVHAPFIGSKPAGKSDASITFWDDADRGGQSFTLTNQECPYVGDRFNDQISSIEVTSGTWQLRKDAAYHGDLFEVAGPRYFPNLGKDPSDGDWQDVISSVALVSYDPPPAT